MQYAVSENFLFSAYTKADDRDKEQEQKKRVMIMNEETYGALKRIVRDVKEYYALKNRDFPVIMGNDVQLVENWIKQEEEGKNGEK